MFDYEPHTPKSSPLTFALGLFMFLYIVAHMG